MPKIKTKRAAAKRFHKTGSGKYAHFKSGKSHLLTHKSRKRKRRLRQDQLVDETRVRSVQRMVPYL
ncbi:50S ribosomal protein L35 [Dissulfurirhabdus thermomarina]|uniref:Large ribosomal subunit protein bL35 n=1 Tax=Dissulfurirhabdus thermomarina TaxID=1765737 RepID=A0A6N9TRT6_DISTH|nr:50S ribosomal protein L35 [Dissulfurirhabdus thermomarina]NDY41286.1 50S ribosomal protein L35 [Dissulfurirhabdus thermomarina]NMX23743.1 50S ribosomal protein L35 [Dissulfurirhabdus thermomarina]